MTQTKKNIALVGCGYWGKNLARTAHGLGVLAAVSDSDATRADAFAKEYGVPALDFDAILADKAIEGVLLPLPAPLHAQMTLKALAAGKHVMVEKPIALSAADADAMIACANDNDRILMVGHVLQYHPAFAALQTLVADGTLGKLRRIHSSRLNFGKVRTEENVFWSFAPHDVSMMLALAGREPTEITCTGDASLHESDIASDVHAHFNFGDGLTGHIHVSWLNPFKEQKMTVVGDTGMAVFDDTAPWAQKLALYRNNVVFENGTPILNKAEPEYLTLQEDQPLRAEIDHFAQCMMTGRTPRTDGAEAARVLKVMQACDQLMGGS